ncbi:sensor histidine kinase [Kitasatospora viridis]|uniref:Oxygen sensor histidine kinase NreB n=1 Tax=Kitasatospora viridis TaxID=281105 RepID=A0A561UJZ3_9ACTN|nr:sensor histidine kinase [Kitasatospora viridis]TWF99690.1 signal transduction histidine kinase [Kitasatospora viridis]
MVTVQQGDRAAERPDGTEGRSVRVQRYLPYAGLAFSTVLAFGLGPGSSTRYRVAVLAVSGLAALWQWLMAVPVVPAAPGEPRPVKAVVFYVGLLVLIGVLVVLSPFYGFFAFSGYLHVAALPRRFWWLGVAVTAALMATTQVGGVQNLHGTVLGLYAGLVLVNLVIAGALTQQSIDEDRRSRQRAAHIDELAEANRQLRETMEENAGLHAQLVVQAREAGVLDERQRMAGEIHDTIAQGLTGIVTQLEAAERFDHDPERRLHHLATARRLARESLAEARRSVQALRPGPLAEAHLPEAVQDLAARWTAVSGVTAGVTVTGVPFPLSPTLEVVLFRAAQEGLANIAKHARADRVGLTLSYTHEVVLLDVLDDGVGFDPVATEAAGGESYGLTAMRQRLKQVGGSLAVESGPGEGTALSVSVPALRVPGPGITASSGQVENAP